MAWITRTGGAGGRGPRRRWSTHEIIVSDPTTLRRAIAGTAIGNFTEWYDFGAYGFLATTIATVFFPGNGAGSAQLIGTFATLAAAFVVRPFGGMVFGPLGDRIGRKRVLMMTILLMALATTVTGLLPGYASVGVWAPILLLLLRLVQGFSTGGEYVGAMIYIGEHSPDRTRGALSGWLPFGTLSGYICGAALATGLTFALSDQAMTSWGWRLPFLVAAPLSVVGLYIRMRLEETPAFEKLEREERTDTVGTVGQLRDIVVQQWRPLLVCVGLVLTFNVTNYMLTGYLPTYFSDVMGVAQTPGLAIIVAVMVVLLISVTFVAKLSDRIGRKPIMWVGCGLLVLGSVPTFWLLRHGSGYGTVFIGAMLIGLMLLCFNSTEPSTLPTLFPTSIRYGSLGIGFNVSVAVFGGTTPLICQALVSGTGSALAPAYYLVFAGLVGAASVALLPEPAGRRLPGSAPAVATEEEAREVAESR